MPIFIGRGAPLLASLLRVFVAMFPLKIEVDNVELCDICEIDRSIVDVSKQLG